MESSTLIVLGQVAEPAVADRPGAMAKPKHTPTAVIHYFYFDREPIIPYKINRIESEPKWRYEFSHEDTIKLYRLLRNPGNHSAFSWRFTRLIIDKNPWGPRTLVEGDGHVKMKSYQYRLTADQVTQLRKFIFARIPPPP